jgi:hypothetical protein
MLYSGAAVQGVVALAGSAYATAIAVGIFNAAAAQPPTATERQVLIRERAAGGMGPVAAQATDVTTTVMRLCSLIFVGWDVLKTVLHGM